MRELTLERDDVCRTLGLQPSNESIDVYLFRDAEHYQEYLTRNFPNVPSRRAFFLETDTLIPLFGLPPQPPR